MEFVEMLKVDEKFLYSLLTLSQEQSIKTGRFAMIYADEVILSHTNENEYIAFAGNRKSEALQDRIILVKVPTTCASRRKKGSTTSCCTSRKRCAMFTSRRTR